MSSSGERPAPFAPRWSLAISLLLAAVVWGVSVALRYAWTCDDAYIVFRYARNLASGLGLVFNAGERVEGFTDLLWVLWTVPAFRIGLSPEAWTNAWSITCYGGAILLLGLDHMRLVRRAAAPAWAVIPVAALAAAAHPDWGLFATSGLETSAFTFLLVAGYVVLVGGPLGPSRAGAAGLLFGLSALTRPDGVLPALVGGGFVLATSRRRLAPAASYAAAALALWLPAELFRFSYYGSLVPNTFWAKSADLAWWAQGFRYMGLYFEKYGILLLAVPLGLVPLLTRGALRDQLAPRAALAFALTLSYGLYVARIGGDFMYARMLIPLTPFLLVLFETGWTALSFRTPVPAMLVLAALPIAVPSLMKRPVTGAHLVYGVADEWDYYNLKKTTETDFRGEVLARFFRGLPVRMLAYGSEMRLAYRAEVPLVVEAHGLTDPAIARQPLLQRGRPGHEKLPSPVYAVASRRLDVAFHAGFYERNGFPAYIPIVPIHFGRVTGLLLHWDPALVSEWRKRGAVLEDFPSWLDRYLEDLPRRSDAAVRSDYQRFRLFYFDFVRDPARERPFRERLGTS